MSTWMIFRMRSSPTPAFRSGNGGTRIILAAGRNDLESTVRQRPLQRLGLVPRCAHPDVVFFSGRQNDRHRLRMHPPDFRVRFGREEGEDVGSDLALLGFAHAGPVGP